MNRLQAQIIENTNRLPVELLQELVDFSEFLKQKVQNQAFKKRMELSERDVKEGNITTVTPDELFKELDI